MSATTTDSKSFWEHLDELRTVLVRSLAVAAVCAIAAFVLKEALFDLVLAPKHADFVSYRLLDRLLALCGQPPLKTFNVELINTGLATQFMIHMKAALVMGVICASPYIVYALFSYISPALYARERRAIVPALAGGYAMFAAGAAVSYFIVFPLTFRFLGTYQVSAEVGNFITLESYVSTLAVMSLMLGIVFEMPVVAWVLGRLGIINAAMLRRFRRHALVAILVVAAIITPTTDAVTLLVVSAPMMLLYELSILLVRSYKKNS